MQFMMGGALFSSNMLWRAAPLYGVEETPCLGYQVGCFLAKCSMGTFISYQVMEKSVDLHGSFHVKFISQIY